MELHFILPYRFFPHLILWATLFFFTRFLLIFTKQWFLICLIPSCYGKHLCYRNWNFVMLTRCWIWRCFFMCSDFLTKSYDVGGVVSVMALNSLYVLMTQYGLEYPNFYVKLYALLVPSIFMAKHRARFFQVKLIKSLLHTSESKQKGIASKNNAHFSCTTKICYWLIKLL